MKLLIAGSRTIESFDLKSYIPEGVTSIISGGAKGIDKLAEKYADENNIPKIVVLPEYEKYGRAAPIKRDDLMVDMADSVLVIWDGVSKGSRHTIEYAKKKNKPLNVVKACKSENE